MDKTRTGDGLNCIKKGCTCKEVFLKKVDSRTMPNHLPCLSLPLLDKAYESIVPMPSSRVQNCLAIPWTSWYTSSVFHGFRTEKSDRDDPFSVNGKIRSI